MRSTWLFPVLLLAVASGAISARAQDANSAKSFLSEAYTHYRKGDKGAVPSASNASRYIHSSLRALMVADEKAVGTDVPISGDGDLFCDCQEWFGIYDLKIDVKMLSPGRAEAAVSFVLSDSKDPKEREFYSRSLLITLVAERGQWRVYNVVSYRKGEAPSDLRKNIEKEIQYYAQASKSKTAQP